MNTQSIPVEKHPWPPFVPPQPLVLMLGTFPPKRERWSMDFFYPNRINDMWRIMGIIFYGDRNHFWIEREKRFNLPEIKRFLCARHIALWDTAMSVRRLKDNASDKFLDIVETIDLKKFLDQYPTVEAIVTAGEKATGVIAGKAGVEVPRSGESTRCHFGGHSFELYRMPSSSRAYPLALDKKADAYRSMFFQLGYEV